MIYSKINPYAMSELSSEVFDQQGIILVFGDDCHFLPLCVPTLKKP